MYLTEVTQMSAATYVIIGLQIVLCLILIVVILFQNGNQRGLSGSIAGGAETFFGKNKGRTIDAKLKKWTAVIAILFLISSIALGFMVDNDLNKADSTVTPPVEQQVEGEVQENEAAAPQEGEAPAEGEGETAETPAE